MPHLQFDINKKINAKTKKKLMEKLINIFSEIMETGNEHIAVSIREFSQHNLSLGRTKPGELICLGNIDLRVGRTEVQKRKLSTSVIRIFYEYLEIKTKNQYITFTEHRGEDFNLFERNLPNWKKDDLK